MWWAAHLFLFFKFNDTCNQSVNSITQLVLTNIGFLKILQQGDKILNIKKNHIHVCPAWSWTIENDDLPVCNRASSSVSRGMVCDEIRINWPQFYVSNYFA